jgi:hypothetical protein
MIRRMTLMMGAVALCTALTAAPSIAAGTTGTTGTTGTVHTRLTCDPSTKTKGTPPAIGATATFQAGSAGSVVVKRVDQSDVAVASVTAATNWTDTETVASGHRVKVVFRNASTKELQHFGLAISARGTFVIESTSHCHH